MKRRPRPAALLLGLLLGIGAAAQPPAPTTIPVTVTLAPAKNDLEPQAAKARVRAKAVGGVTGSRPAEPIEAVETGGEAPGKLTLQLAPGTLWEITVQVDGYWAAPALLDPAQSTHARLELWPTGRLLGRLHVPTHETLPETVGIRFEGGQGGEIPESHLECPVEANGVWKCAVPAGALDLRVRAASFVSHFFWERDVRAGILNNLGVQQLERGASLVGFVEAAAGGELAEICTVELEPMAAGRPTDTRDRERFERLKLTRFVGPQGFFHFQGIPPGSYRVTAQQTGMAPSALAPISVLPDTETEIRDPLVLHPPAVLAVQLEPPVDPFDRPWKVELWQRSEIVGHADVVGSWDADAGGRLERTGLDLGDYALFVKDRQGAQWAAEDVRMEGGRTLVTVELPVVWVEGTVHLGDEPLSAEVTFGGPFGAQKVQMVADQDGEFFGVLPKDGAWLVYVENEDPAVTRYFYDVAVEPGPSGGVARVRLELPDTRVEGEVVDSEGRPTGRALVRVYEENAQRKTVTVTDEEGEFTFRGLKEGPIRLVAEKGSATSRPHRVELTEDVESPSQRLVLEERQAIHGRVVDPQGRGLPGVALTAHSVQGTASLLDLPYRVTTDVDGRFELDVPSSATHVQITAYPPGYTLTPLALMPIPDEPVLIQPERHGGSLVLEIEEPLEWERAWSPKPALFLEGLPISFEELQNWAAVQGHRYGADTTRFIVPALPPGRYLACLEAVYHQVKQVQFQPSPANCQEVLVTPFSEQTVELGDPGAAQLEGGR